ncbi:hypothetical protein QUC31_011923 [Theobroma cacao]
MFPVLNNLLLVFVFAIASFGASGLMLTGGIQNEDVGRRKLVTENPGFISIDCGANGDYHDEATGIVYRTDRDFIDTGENHEGRNNSYFVSAFFHYGNYDSTKQPPKFDLYLGVNYRDTVTLDNASSPKYYEIIHVFSAESDTQFVCLVNTGSGIPFISALELRLPDISNSIYTTDLGALKHVKTYDLGISPSSPAMRYNDDVYDRIWHPYAFSNSEPIGTSQGIDDFYGLEVVLRTADRPADGLSSLNYTMIASNSSMAEIKEIAQYQLREFSITLNDINYGPITVHYLKPMSLRSNLQSKLTPIISFDMMVVDAVVAIKHAYNISRDDWQGDPCLPKEYSWNGLNCSVGIGTPRIISLSLSSCNLTGQIPLSLSKLQALESL